MENWVGPGNEAMILPYLLNSIVPWWWARVLPPLSKYAVAFWMHLTQPFWKPSVVERASAARGHVYRLV